MSQNKQTVKKYMDAFGRTDHKEILVCFTWREKKPSTRFRRKPRDHSHSHDCALPGERAAF